MRSLRPALVGCTVLATWACAKANDLPGDDTTPFDPTANAGGSSGSSMQSNTGGSAQGGSGGGVMPTGGAGGSTGGAGGSTGGGATGGGSATGGVSAAGGADSTGGIGGTVSAGGRGADGGATAMAGRSASGGATETGGTDATGGATGAGGDPAVGGVSNAGGNAAGGASGGSVGGTGAAGVPNDPNWKPPDMSAAKLIVLYQVQQKDAMTYSVGMMLQLKNQSDAAYDLSKVTIRYWFSSEAAPMPRFDYTAQGLSAAAAPTFVSNMANSYVQMTFKAGGTVPVYVDQNSLNNTNMSVAVQAQSNTGQFNQSNDWSFDATASAYKANPKITLYDGTTLIWGCEPSHVCASTDAATGTAGSGAM